MRTDSTYDWREIGEQVRPTTQIVFERGFSAAVSLVSAATRSEPHRLALGAPVAAEKRFIFNGLAGQIQSSAYRRLASGPHP